MRARRRGPRRTPSTTNTIAGAVLVVLACLEGPWAVPVLMVGLSLVVHFGVLTFAAALLQGLGFRARVLFDAPLTSRSLQEFWAQRWNRGFAEMTALCVQRPLARFSIEESLRRWKQVLATVPRRLALRPA